MKKIHNHDDGIASKSATNKVSKATTTNRSRENNNIDGTNQGIIMQWIALLVCIWLFSIPTEFRRAHFCTTNQCTTNRSKCYDCVTFGEWIGVIAKYYQNGGGIQFDFSIGDETKEIFR
jgi:hypothetical protein